MSDRIGRARFMTLAVIFEGSLVLVALALGWIFRIDVLSGLQPGVISAAIGLSGAIPPFALLLLAERLRIAALERIKKILLETLGPWLLACRWYDVIVLAVIAGIGEEFLFRGALQPLFERWTVSSGWGGACGLILSNLIFGLLHFITPTYAILAGLMGLYFGLLLDVTEPRSLLAPILAHGLYDYLAFLVLIRSAKAARSLANATEADGPPPGD
jgi:uncharacterized protein